jgi:ABC-type Mn2+/Zn2+ transport systems, permease components
VEWWLAPFELGFQQRALIGGMLAALMASTVGTWLVLRGMSFFGDAFVHGVIPGVAAAVVLDINPLLGAAVAAAIMVFAIELVQRKTVLGEDTSIGLLFVGMLALGVVIISRLDSYSGSLTSILFGDALGVTWNDIVGQLVVLAIVVIVSTVLYRPLIALSLSRDKAELLGMRPGLAHAALLVLDCSGSHRKLSIRWGPVGVWFTRGPSRNSQPPLSDYFSHDAYRGTHWRCVGLARPHHQLLLGNGRVRHDGACSHCFVFCRVEREEHR